jgi:hypothetical protein
MEGCSNGGMANYPSNLSIQQPTTLKQLKKQHLKLAKIKTVKT